jgi:hypothetical protein
MSERRLNSFYPGQRVDQETASNRRPSDFQDLDNGSPNTVDVRDLHCRIDLNTDKR